MSFLIRPLTDLTNPLYNIVRGEPAKRQQETEKLITETFRTSAAVLTFFLARQILIIPNKSVKTAGGALPLVALGYFHPYSGLLGMTGWYALRGTRSESLTQNLWLNRAIDLTLSIGQLWALQHFKKGYQVRLDGYFINLSKMIASRLFNNGRT